MPPKVLPLLLVALPACNALNQSGDAGAPPIIDSLTMASSAVIGSDGTYDISGTISFHSPTSSAVSTVHVVAPDVGVDEQIPLSNPGTTETGVAIVANFPSSIPIGTTVTYAVSILDAAGAESTALTEMVTVD
jgi:hypothetical protein